LLQVEIRESKIGHVEISKQRRLIFDFLLSVPQAKTKKSHLVAIAFSALSLEIARVVPPLDFIVGMGRVIRGKGKFPSRQCQLVSEAGGEIFTLTLPSPVEGEG